MESRVIIAGKRDFNDYDYLKEKVDKILNDMNDLYNIEKFIIVSGCAIGTDKLGEQYAEEHKLELQKIPAKWFGEGSAAGENRNNKMLKYILESDIPVLIAFWDLKSQGTGHMINIAMESEKTYIFIIDYNNDRTYLISENTLLKELRRKII